MNIGIYTNGGPDRPTGVARYWVNLRDALKGTGIGVHWCDATKGIGELDKCNAANTLIVTAVQMAPKIPAKFGVIGVQHGCAGEHKRRVPDWRDDGCVAAQVAAAKRPRTFLVGCSEWAAHFGKEHTGATAGRIIYGAVDVHAFRPSERQRRRDASVPVVLHHCADPNKGSGLVDKVAAALKGEFAFRKLDVSPASVPAAMQGADIWLCLSASEGLPTVVQEAMAVNLLVVGTDVGVLWPPFAGEDTGATVFDWRKRGDAAFVADRIREGWQNRAKADGRLWAATWWNLSLFGQKWQDCIRLAAGKLGVA